MIYYTNNGILSNFSANGLRRYVYLKSSVKGIIAVVAFLAVFAIVTLIVTTTLNNATKTSFSEIQDALMSGNVKTISINNDKVSVKYVDGYAKTKKNKSYDE